MSLMFIFPSDYYQCNRVDEMFSEQVNAFSKAGFDCGFINIDELEPISKLTLDLTGKTVIYRGWMLNADTYLKFSRIIENSYGNLFISLDKYLLAHHIPNWYPLIKDYTIETVVLDHTNDLRKQLLNIGWGQFFVKDYVKSLKTSVGSIIKNTEHIDTVIREMKNFRGVICEFLSFKQH
jgi:hypothetical protein